MLGAAYLAAWQTGIVDSAAAAARLWQLDARFEPVMNAATRARLLDGWQHAVGLVKTKE